MKKKSIIFVSIVLCCLFLFACGSKTNGQSTSETLNKSSEIETQKNSRLSQLALDLFWATDYNFEENQEISSDKLLNYFTVFEICDKNGAPKKEYLPYLIEQNKIDIPKKIVDDFLSKKFSVKINSTNSSFETNGNKNNYTLESQVRDGYYVQISNVEEKGNYVIFVANMIESVENKIFEQRKICIENYDNENFKYIFSREIKK